MFLKKIILVFCVCLLISKNNAQHTKLKIDRHALVSRHNVVNTKMDTMSSLTVGNGRFAFTVDATGLQTFPLYYQQGVPLGTQSQWGWGSFTNVEGYKFCETLQTYTFNGKQISYPIQFNQPKRKQDAANWFRENQHRLQLGNIGFIILKKNGTEAKPEDIKNIRQELNLWTGEIKSHFRVENELVDVSTYGDAHFDGIGIRIKSSLIKKGRIAIRIRFPFVNNQFADYGTNYSSEQKHKSAIILYNKNKGIIEHQINSADYQVKLSWLGNALLKKSRPHEFILTPSDSASQFSFTTFFITGKKGKNTPTRFSDVSTGSISGWKKFWNSGAAVDFSGSTDPRANELERRVVLSQYLTKVQCAGDEPPQETGLTYNSWYGKAHLEMHWWHGVHFALWGRAELLTPSMDWYEKIKNKGWAIARRQGFEGIRWPKMVDRQGNESPSNIAPFLIWQQPHFIYFAELAFRADKGTIDKYKDLVFATADFMASFAYFDKEKNRYTLGPGIITSQEVSKPEETLNPPYELVYWYWALSIAQKWRERLKQSRVKKWDDIMNKISPLPKKDGLYLADENAPDSYTNPKYLTDHPAVLAAYGVLPYTKMIDTSTMRRSYEKILNVWNWPRSWGWDFPMMAMTSARLNRPEQALDALFMDIQKNSYLANGHNYQDQQLTIYLPGNGGLLTAIAMMCAGWDGSSGVNPGFPKNKKWKIKWEGLQKMP